MFVKLTNVKRPFNLPVSMGSHQSISQEHQTERMLTQNSRKIEDLTFVLDVKAKSHNVLSMSDNHQYQETYKHYQESLRTLKSLFKQLDPAIVHAPGVMHGQVQLSFKYDVKRHLLLVKLIKCRELHTSDVRTKTSATYAKLQMFPDIHGHGIKTSQMVRETRNPAYNEMFAFRASKAELRESQLIFQIWDHDLTSQDDFLGEAIIEIKSLNIKDEPVVTAWYDLKMETDLTITGELCISLAFQPPHNLSIMVHSATGLSPRTGHESADPVIKVAIPGLGAYFSSQVQKNTLDPEWEETFEFEIPVEELFLRCITFDILDNSDLRSEKVIMGQAVYNLEALDSQKGFHGKLKLADLRNTAFMQNNLMQHVVTQEIREACLAHTSARLPQFLFGPLSGTKMVSVSCRKAGRKSVMKGHIRLVDGVPVR